MPVNNHEAKDILETLAFQTAAESAQQGRQHYSRIARLPAGSWQAELIRESRDVTTADSAEALRRVMAKPEVAVIFLPQTAFVTGDIIERICSESPLSKMIIWETGVA
jgi:mannitol-1-phosphate/altronate dehydrogenase